MPVKIKSKLRHGENQIPEQGVEKCFPSSRNFTYRSGLRRANVIFKKHKFLHRSVYTSKFLSVSYFGVYFAFTGTSLLINCQKLKKKIIDYEI